MVWPTIAILLTLSTSDGLTVPLTGYGWSLWSPTARNRDTWSLANVSLPGDVYLSLFENGKTADPYFRDNDVKLRWISYQNWTYQRSIDISQEIAKKKAILLIGTGLDTIAEIYVNDALVGNSSNVFRTYFYDLRNSIRAGSNILRIDFASPVNYSRDQAAEYKRKYNYSVPLDCHPKNEHGECHANFIRKMQFHFGWDFGPAFPTTGLTGDLAIQAFDTCFFKSFSVVPTLDKGDDWILRVEFWLYCADTSVGKVDLKVSNADLKLNYSWTEKVQSKEINRFYKEIPLSKDANVELWWPNGLGQQKLYEITGEFSSANERDTKKLQVGFRRIQLVQDPIPNVKNGLTFYMKINNVPTFLKGSNWIPGDSFLSRLTEDRLLFYFESMREANFNCIRAWGGGVYETDRFYELADQYGIAIWQDMMFAVNLYPGSSDFLQNVEAEIDDQINRLKHHASIVIWAGNNENEVGIAQGWFPFDAPYDVYKRDYLALYNTTIYGVVNRTDFQSRPFVLSSQSNGIETIAEGGLAKNPGDTMYGDVHFYQYTGGDAWNWTFYPTPRCATEFGFQSFPSLSTFRTALADGDLHYFSPQVLHRQHHPLGEFQMLAEMVRHFKFFGNSSLLLKFDDFIYLSQIHQALAYKTEVEHYRRWRSKVSEKGEGLTMCALYWQLNDIWQAPTWASIDYGLKWKMAHYYAKKFYAPVIVSPFIDQENLKVAVVNDLNQAFENVTVIIETHSWNKLGPVFETNVSIARLEPSSSQFVYSAGINSLKAPLNYEPVWVLFNTRILDSQGRPLGPNNVLFPDNIRFVTTDNFGKVAIDQVWLETTNGTKPIFGVSVVANRVAPFVWLDADGVQGYFSDNGFAVLEKNFAVQFTSWTNVTVDEFKKALTVKTLGDLYRMQKLGA